MTQAHAEFIALQRVVSGRYSLERELGRGGMGIVFLARDVALGRRVAIKLLPPGLAEQPERRRRFLREARTAAALFHPNIVPIHLVEDAGDVVFFVMAYVHGETLGQRVRRAGPMTAAAVARMIQEVAWALAYAHDKGVVHRDIKPDNILLERPSNRALVTDFGIAKVAGARGATGEGEILGTVDYMSPEQATGASLDGRSDLYALGATAFFALTGRPPFQAENALAVIQQHVSMPAPPVAALVRGASVRLAEVVDRCLAKSPTDRFENGEALAAALAGAPAQTPVPPEIRRILRRIRTVSVLVGGLSGMAIFTGGLAWREIERALGQMEMLLGVMAALLAAETLRLFYRLLTDTRRALQSGYGHAFVRDALLAESRALIEEGALEIQNPDPEAGAPALVFHPSGALELLPARVAQPANPVLKAGFRRDRDIRTAPLGGGVGVTLLGIGLAGDVLFLTAFGSFVVAASLVLFSAGPPVGKDSPLVALDLGERMLFGRFGRLLFRLARRGRRDPAPAESPAAPTEMVLAAAIEDLLARLPEGFRARLGDVRDVVAALEREGVALRQREARLSEALASVEIGRDRGGSEGQQKLRGDLERTRALVRERLATTVAAIEGIRLDLIRLHAGVASPEDLTAQLERAREVATAVDAQLAARREVQELVAPPTVP